MIMWTNRILDEMNRFFAPLGAGLRGNGAHLAPYPALNVWEDDDHLFVEAELPGYTNDKIEVTVSEGDQLTIAGEREPAASEGSIWHRQESGYGQFQRTVTLPIVVDSDKVAANFDSGVLTLTLPKSEMAKPKRIAVRGADSGKVLAAS
jgi:HSP20 family protein